MSALCEECGTAFSAFFDKPLSTYAFWQDEGFHKVLPLSEGSKGGV